MIFIGRKLREFNCGYFYILLIIFGWKVLYKLEESIWNFKVKMLNWVEVSFILWFDLERVVFNIMWCCV